VSTPATELAEPGQLSAYRTGDPDQAVAAAEAAVRSYCRWHIAPARSGVDVTVDGTGSSVQPLPTLHLTNVTNVVEDGSSVDLADVQWSQAGYLWRAQPFTRTLRGITATIDHGYAEVPLEVRAVVLAVAARAVVSPDGIVRSQVGQVSVQFSQPAANVAGGVSLFEHEARVLDRYRLPEQE
jgi:hypothetical protein